MSTLPLSCIFATSRWVEKRACRASLPRRGALQRPSFTDLDDAPTAAGVCRQCPVATDCLLEALRADASHRRHEDPIGITGVYGGVWFDPDQPPQRVLGAGA